ncbi:MAG: hypothetical protein ACYTEQ_01770 [Planctomycetota bacterium]|jgi:hypothetical protein
MGSTAVQEYKEPLPLTPADMGRQVALVQDMMKSVMRDGEHYGKIPGCGPKPTLLKPGAEKLCMTFRLSPDIDVEVVNMEGLHREYRVKVTLYSPTGQRLGSGVGSCSTMEKKYKGKAPNFIFPPDVYNTCLKMAKKRALVDAVLTTTAASDIFTQDVEEMRDIIAKAEPTKTESVKPAPKPKAAAPPPPPPKEVTVTEDFGSEEGDRSEPTLSVQDTLYKELAIACGLDEGAMGTYLRELSEFEGKDGEPVYMKLELRSKWSEKWAGKTLGSLREAATDDYMPESCPGNPEPCDSSYYHEGEARCRMSEAVPCPYGIGKKFG